MYRVALCAHIIVPHVSYRASMQGQDVDRARINLVSPTLPFGTSSLAP